MPCNCDHMEPHQHELEASRVLCLLDELDGKKWTRSDWEGYHKKAYGKNPDVHELTASLCTKLQSSDVREYSLEMQMWWRDHKKADKARLKAEMEEKKNEAEREKALSKLSAYERELLNL